MGLAVAGSSSGNSSDGQMMPTATLVPSLPGIIPASSVNIAWYSERAESTPLFQPCDSMYTSWIPPAWMAAGSPPSELSVPSALKSSS